MLSTYTHCTRIRIAGGDVVWVAHTEGWTPAAGCQWVPTHAGCQQSLTLVLPACCAQYDDFPSMDGGDKTRQDADVQQERYSRHGWGDTSLLKEGGTTRRSEQVDKHGGKRQLGSHEGKDGRKGMFGVLHQTEAGGPDCWIGNALIHPEMVRAHILTAYARTCAHTCTLAHTVIVRLCAYVWKKPVELVEHSHAATLANVLPLRSEGRRSKCMRAVQGAAQRSPS